MSYFRITRQKKWNADLNGFNGLKTDPEYSGLEWIEKTNKRCN